MTPEALPSFDYRIWTQALKRIGAFPKPGKLSPRARACIGTADHCMHVELSRPLTVSKRRLLVFWQVACWLEHPFPLDIVQTASRACCRNRSEDEDGGWMTRKFRIPYCFTPAQQFPKLDSIPNRDVVQLGNGSYMPGLGENLHFSVKTLNYIVLAKIGISSNAYSLTKANTQAFQALFSAVGRLSGYRDCCRRFLYPGFPSIHPDYGA
jgi:hypothetical protein